MLVLNKMKEESPPKEAALPRDPPRRFLPLREAAARRLVLREGPENEKHALFEYLLSNSVRILVL